MSEFERVPFGGDGVLVSPVGFGAAGLGNEYGDMDDAAATDVVRYAFERGITYFDTSAYYGRGLSERRLGVAVAPFRNEIFLATKGGRVGRDADTGFDFSRQAVISHCYASLDRLGVDHVDLYQLHDVEFGEERQLVDGAFEALFEIRARGLARHVGVTGYPTGLLARLAARFPVDSVLSYGHYNLMNRTLDRELAPMARDGRFSLINASILQLGLLTESGPQPWHPAPAAIRQAARRVLDVCAEAGVAGPDVATAFACAHPDVAVTLIGSLDRSTLDRSLAARRSIIDEGLLAAIDAALGEDLDRSWTSGRPEHFEPGALAPDLTEETS